MGQFTCQPSLLHTQENEEIGKYIDLQLVLCVIIRTDGPTHTMPLFLPSLSNTVIGL